MRSVLLAASLLVVVAMPAEAHTLGACVPGGVERCERWSAVFDTPAADPVRSDQFPTALAASATTAFLGARDVRFRPDDPYDGTRGDGAVVAYDLDTGLERWRRAISTRPYDSVNDVAVSADGAAVFATGAAYDAWSIAAADSRMVTTALDAATGAVRWQATWDALPTGRDTAKVVSVDPAGRRVFVGGITQTANGKLDYVVVAYDAASGRERWTRTYDGLGLGRGDVMYAMAVTPDGSRVVVTGDSDGLAEFDTDVATLAYDARNGRLLWEHRLDGRGAQKSDRVNALAVDADRAYVTGDSSPAQGGSIDVQTAALDLRTGAAAWVVRQDPSAGRFDTGRAIAAAGGRVVVSAQTPSPTDGEGLDVVTTALDGATGAPAWSARRAQPRFSELANDVVASSRAVFVAASARPAVQYTALDEQVVEAYDLQTGAPLWGTRLDAGAGNALTGDHLALDPRATTLVTAGQRTLSADPLGPPSQDVYDTIVAAFDAE